MTRITTTPRRTRGNFWKPWRAGSRWTRLFTIAAYEDVFYYLWKERKLPVNVDPLDSKLADPIERGRVARIFEQGLDQPVGYVLPLRVSRPHGYAALDQPALVFSPRSRCF